MIIPVLSSLETPSVASLGEPDRGEDVKKIGNCVIHRWLDQRRRDEYMSNAKIIVFSGGHGTCFEVIKHRKPSICIPTQPEQMGNARKLQDLRCSISVENKAQLRSAILEIEEKIESYKENVRKINEYSRGFRGVEKAVDVIESIL
jgi:UDP:flavonoid glycosyltransferase YjiC (YdhE family)